MSGRYFMGERSLARSLFGLRAEERQTFNKHNLQKNLKRYVNDLVLHFHEVGGLARDRFRKQYSKLKSRGQEIVTFSLGMS